GGGFICYLKNGAAPWAGDGPVWNVGDGKFGVLGDDDKWRATGFLSEPGKWHKVTLRVDVPRNEWQFFVGGQKFQTPRPPHRAPPAAPGRPSTPSGFSAKPRPASTSTPCASRGRASSPRLRKT